MGRAISIFCCLIVALQFLIGVPAAICLIFFAIYGGLGPIAIEVHPGPAQSPHMFIHSPTVPPPSGALSIAPPPNFIPQAPTTAMNNPILEARAQHGSPLTGTILSESAPPNIEQELFVAAYEKVAAEAAHEAPPAPSRPASLVSPTGTSTCLASPCSQTDSPNVRQQADNFAVQRLYEIAEMDERTGNYERADQWRALAREIRQPVKLEDEVSAPPEGASTDLPPLDLP